MGGKKVKGKSGKKPQKRVPAAPPVETFDDRCLGWRTGQIDFQGEWGWAKLDPADAPRLRQELVAFEGESLQVLKDKRWVKFISTKEMDYKARDRLAEIEKDDEGLWQLHLAFSKWRVWGFLDGAVFYFLWWDPTHSVATGKCRNRKT